MNWNWQKLVIALVSAILGWLSSIVVPTPGSAKPVPAPTAVERLK